MRPGRKGCFSTPVNTPKTFVHNVEAVNSGIVLPRKDGVWLSTRFRTRWHPVDSLERSDAKLVDWPCQQALFLLDADAGTRLLDLATAQGGASRSPLNQHADCPKAAGSTPKSEGTKKPVNAKAIYSPEDLGDWWDPWFQVPWPCGSGPRAEPRNLLHPVGLGRVLPRMAQAPCLLSHWKLPRCHCADAALVNENQPVPDRVAQDVNWP